MGSFLRDSFFEPQVNDANLATTRPSHHEEIVSHILKQQMEIRKSLGFSETPEEFLMKLVWKKFYGPCS